MKRFLCLATFTAMTGLFSQCAFAQDSAPVADVFFGYSFLRANSAQQIPAFTANGGLMSVGFNFNNHLAFEAEFAGYHNGNINNREFDTTSYSYVFGPRLSYGRSKTFDPYLHVLFGVNRLTTSILASSTLLPRPTPPVAGVDGARVEASQSNFAMPVGGGLDIKVGRSILLRPIQLDYYLTRFQTPTFFIPANGATGVTTTNKNQHNLRFAAGITFTFGAR